MTALIEKTHISRSNAAGSPNLFYTKKANTDAFKNSLFDYTCNLYDLLDDNLDIFNDTQNKLKNIISDNVFKFVNLEIEFCELKIISLVTFCYYIFIDRFGTIFVTLFYCIIICLYNLI